MYRLILPLAFVCCLATFPAGVAARTANPPAGNPRVGNPRVGNPRVGNPCPAAAESVVQIICLQSDMRTLLGCGSGFFVQDGSIVATAGHIYWESSKSIAENRHGGAVYARKSDTDGHSFLVKLDFIKADEVHDLALFRFDRGAAVRQWPGFVTKPLRFAAAKPQIGDEICAIGYFGADDFPTALKGIVSALTRPAPGGADEELLMNISAIPGQSGCPVLNWQTGEVVGLMTSYVPIVLTPGGPQVSSGISRATEAEHITELIEPALP